MTKQKILAFSGTKQSGKSTCVNFLHGYEMKRNNVIAQFEINDRGQLMVNAVFTDDKGQTSEGMGILDVNRQDFEFASYASRTIWPHVRSYSFATPLKRTCMNIFGLSWDQCYGNEENKNTLTDIKILALMCVEKLKRIYGLQYVLKMFWQTSLVWLLSGIADSTMK